jgi:hypothetical protein
MGNRAVSNGRRFLRWNSLSTLIKAVLSIELDVRVARGRQTQHIAVIYVIEEKTPAYFPGEPIRVGEKKRMEFTPETKSKNWRNGTSVRSSGVRLAGKRMTRMKTIVLIDTRLEVPGVSLGILVSTHPDVMPLSPPTTFSRRPKPLGVTSGLKSSR